VFVHGPKPTTPPGRAQRQAAATQRRCNATPLQRHAAATQRRRNATPPQRHAAATQRRHAEEQVTGLDSPLSPDIPRIVRQ
jgi:hypothetical protein